MENMNTCTYCLTEDLRENLIELKYVYCCDDCFEENNLNEDDL